MSDHWLSLMTVCITTNGMKVSAMISIPLT